MGRDLIGYSLLLLISLSELQAEVTNGPCGHAKCWKGSLRMFVALSPVCMCVCARALVCACVCVCGCQCMCVPVLNKAVASGANALPAVKHLLTALNQVVGAQINLRRTSQTWERLFRLVLITAVSTLELIFNSSPISKNANKALSGRSYVP